MRGRAPQRRVPRSPWRSATTTSWKYSAIRGTLLYYRDRIEVRLHCRQIRKIRQSREPPTVTSIFAALVQTFHRCHYTRPVEGRWLAGLWLESLHQLRPSSTSMWITQIRDGRARVRTTHAPRPPPVRTAPQTTTMRIPTAEHCPSWTHSGVCSSLMKGNMRRVATIVLQIVRRLVMRCEGWRQLM